MTATAIGESHDQGSAAHPLPGRLALCEAIARVAREQFARWRPAGGPPLSETSAGASRILREYYRVGVGATMSDAQMQSAAFQAAHPWSAVFVSYVMRTAGAGRAFAYSAAHQTYIRAARRNRLTGDAENPFWAFRASEVAPRVGDLVCAARMRSGATYDNIADRRSLATHCDVVVEVHPGRIRVIGGNVGQTVGDKWLLTLPDGRLSLTGRQRGFFAVIRCGGHAGAPAPASDLSSRVVRVVRLLVQRYGLTANGAAGLVGNLMAESSVLPNRIEGSSAVTPMRAPDFSGRLQDFTPEQVRDRNFAQRTGPRYPGVGIVQWTSAQRRAGLFQHTFNGRQLGSAILSDLDAQVDYLASELRRGYRSVLATLMAPNVSVAQASDAVVLRFERPAAVLDRPVADPTVQDVLQRRRRYAAEALRMYQEAR